MFNVLIANYYFPTHRTLVTIQVIQAIIYVIKTTLTCI